MIQKKEWTEFRGTGLVLIINQILHIFGWALVFEYEDGNVKSVYPARVKFRGFKGKAVEDSYKKLSAFMLENAAQLFREAHDMEQNETIITGKPISPTECVLTEVLEERKRQHEKWGEQNFPSLKSGIVSTRDIPNPVLMTDAYGLPPEYRAKEKCNEAMKDGTVTFAHIAVEELCEAISCLGDKVAMRKELIQLAAVAVQWIEAIDRKND